MSCDSAEASSLFGPGELVPRTPREALEQLLDELDKDDAAEGAWFEHWVSVLELLPDPRIATHAFGVVERLMRARGITRIELLHNCVVCHRPDTDADSNDDDCDSRSRTTLADAVLVFPAFPVPSDG